VAKPVDLVIFGASGDLTQRKILPALGRLITREGQAVRVIGAGRSHKTSAGFREMVQTAGANQKLSETAEWVQLEYADPKSFAPLMELLAASPGVIYYLATPPETFSEIVSSLALSGLSKKADTTRRIVVEKPFGNDLASAHKLNGELAAAFEEQQIFRIDHYLAKDTVQNVMALRFSNSLFEPVWNRTLIETILITVAEDEGIGKRAGYYDQSGAVRDIIQNHMLQLLALVTMEPPTTFDPENVRRAKRAALREMSPLEARDLRGGARFDRQLAVGRRADFSTHRKRAPQARHRGCDQASGRSDAAHRRPAPARHPNFDRDPHPARRRHLTSHRRQAARNEVRDGPGRDATRLRKAVEGCAA
jgi:glucose-6-phosphate 1-dehydrogenase